MSLKKVLQILLLFNLFLQVILDDDPIEYEKQTISDMQSTFLSSKKEKIYNLGCDLIDKGQTIIAFADMDGDKLTDIITYQKEGNDYNFFYYLYNKKAGEDKKPKFIKKDLFKFKASESDKTLRNVYVGSFFHEKKDNICFLISFDNTDNKLNHYIVCNDKYDLQTKLNINSNILIMNKDENHRTRLLFYDSNEKKRKICKLNVNTANYCDEENFENYISCPDKDNNLEKDISLKGGMAYVDVDGNCVPDIILTHENGDKRYLEIFTSSREDGKYCLTQNLELGKSDELGAFVITRINDERSDKNAPMLDILVPVPAKNLVHIYKNQKTIEYDWASKYCEKYKKENYQGKEQEIFKLENNQTLEVPDQEVTIDSTFTTVMRAGDFLASSNPGILVTQINKKDNTKIVSLFKREDKNYKHYATIYKGKIGDFDKDDDFKMALFFDIDENGSLSLILPTEKGRNYFFFNYLRNVFFLKSKLMNHEKNLFDVNVGTTYRYIVTDKKGNRHMDVSHQLSQTSDTNIPVPYSLIGLDNTNNYVEYFHTISGDYLNLKEDQYDNKEDKDWKTNTPVIPNTQMMISKYYTSKPRIAWNVDLIVQPMEQIWLFLIIVVLVLIIVLVIIIVLHVREVQEEKKETNKFKSWFA